MENKKPSDGKRRYFDQPDPKTKPLTLWETLAIVLSTHLGVRSSAQRKEDFQRANGLHLFIAGIIYFAAIIISLVVLIFYITK